MSNPEQPVKKICLIVSRGSLDGVYPALIMANGARMEGIEASVFFTFFGLNALVDKTLDHLKVSTVGNSALNMAMPMLGLPMTMPFPTWMGAIPGVSAFATHLMNKEMDKLDIPPVREFLELISDSGGKLYACKLAMDMFKLKREDLSDRVDGVLTVGQFYEEAAGEGSHILFT
ncbi:MAG: DsrE/DsrF/DrsH-like family protein [Verrucomicrobiales bacterium]|nr:DsrE/DsrF/DrsH-like family protein [Verrucomicrobiales bacterium]